MTFQLNSSEIEQYKELGFIGPFKLFEPQEVDSLTKNIVTEKSIYFLRNRIFSRLPGLKKLTGPYKWGKGRWHKGIHITSPLIYELANKAAILDRISSIIGDNVVLWGAIVMTIKPSDNPTWHLDEEVEFLSPLDGAGIWLALSNVNEDSGLRVITRSHRIPRPIAFESTDKANLELAKRVDPNCECVYIHTNPGEFIIFSGAIWHTGGKLPNMVRYALLLQYCKPEATLTIPEHWKISLPIPCVMVRGTSRLDLYRNEVGNKFLVRK